MALLDKKTIELGEHVFLDIVPDLEHVNIRIGNSKGTLVKKVDLWAACFAIADAKMQERLMPVRQTQMTTFRRIHIVAVKKPLNVGDKLRFKCEISVPQVIEEGLAGSLTRKRSKIVIPR